MSVQAPAKVQPEPPALMRRNASRRIATVDVADERRSCDRRSVPGFAALLADLERTP